MRIVTIAAFGAGFVIGARAGRDRYEQLLELARKAGDGMDGGSVRDRLDSYASHLEDFASRNDHPSPGRQTTSTSR